VPLAQLAILWCLKNPNVSTVILGASRLSQLKDNLAALEHREKVTDEVMAKIDEIAGNQPAAPQRAVRRRTRAGPDRSALMRSVRSPAVRPRPTMVIGCKVSSPFAWCQASLYPLPRPRQNGGNGGGDQTRGNPRSWFELCGRTEVEVAGGAAQPLVRDHQAFPVVHGDRGLGRAELPPASRPISDRTGAGSTMA